MVVSGKLAFIASALMPFAVVGGYLWRTKRISKLSSAGLLALSLLMSQITARIACGFIAAEHNAGFFMGFVKAGTVMDNSRAASNIYITNGITLLAAIVALSYYLNFSKGQFDLKKIN